MAEQTPEELAQQLFAARGGNHKDAGPEAKAEQERLAQALFHGPQPGQEGARTDAPGHEAGGEQLAMGGMRRDESFIEFLARQRKEGGNQDGYQLVRGRVLPEEERQEQENDKGGRGGR
jgi:hypothetical protein